MRRIVFNAINEIHINHLEPQRDYHCIYFMPRGSVKYGRVVCWDTRKYYAIDKYREICCAGTQTLDELIKMYVNEYGYEAYLCDDSMDAWQKLMDNARKD